MDVQKQLLSLRKQMIDHTFSRMNQAQKEAVLSVNGPVLILAGAGSGKTTVLIHRIANLIRFGNAYHSNQLPLDVSEEDVQLLQQALAGERVDPLRFHQLTAVDPPRPYEILAITFTNKAAWELKERLSNLLHATGDSIWAMTFHAACLRMLRKFSERIGYSSHFTIYDTDDSKRVIKECQKELGIDDKAFSYRMLMNEISHAKDRLITPEEYKENAGDDIRLKKAALIYAAYQKRLRKADAMDFDDIIVQTVRLLQEHPDVLSYWQNRFRYIMVDEYQDTNHAQYVLVKLLAGERKNLCVVGDDNQSIYTFRGATIENILTFEDEYSDAVTVRLEQNYRSTEMILNAANAVIRNNRLQKEKNLWTELGEGEPITCHTASDEFGEARFVAEKILDGVGQGRSYSDFAVLYRMNAQSGNLENTFVRSGIPYRVIGGLKFYDRKEIKDALAYLHLLVNPDDDLRLRRIINEPKRGIGTTTIDKIASIAFSQGVGMFHVVCHADEYADLHRSASKLQAFAHMINQCRDEMEHLPPHSILELVLEKSGYLESLLLDDNGGTERKENVQELVSGIIQYESETEQPSLDDYLDSVSLMTDMDQYNADQEAVVLMTLHSAKGLEFHTVFMVGMEEGVFPGNQSIYAADKEMEEERRLMYVGITRAKRKLYLTNAYQRLLFGMTNRNRPSRFVGEIPTSCIESTATVSPWFGKSNFSGAADRSFVPSSRVSATFAKSSTPASSPKTSVTPLKVGDRVKHKTFGGGLVVAATPVGGDVLLTISFDAIGTKKLMQKFAKLEKE